MRTIAAVCLSVVVWVLVTRVASVILIQFDYLRNDTGQGFIDFSVAVGCSVFAVYLSKIAADAWIKRYTGKPVVISFGVIVFINLYLEFVANWEAGAPVTVVVTSVALLGAAYFMFWSIDGVEVVEFTDKQTKRLEEMTEQRVELDRAELEITRQLDRDEEDDEELDDGLLAEDLSNSSSQDECAKALIEELDTWPNDKAELAHQFIKCVVLQEGEDKAIEMAQQFSPAQLQFLRSHISEVFRLYSEPQ